MRIQIPDLSLVVLIGPSSAGKSTFARTHFKPTEVVSSDFCRALVSDDENDMDASAAAFEVLHAIVERRLRFGRLAVVDATNVRSEDRRSLLAIAKAQHVFAAAIVFDLPEGLLQARHAARPDRDFGEHVLRNQRREMLRSLRNLEREGFRYVNVLRTIEHIDSVRIERQRLWNDRRDLAGPFDIIGDIHGCYDELAALLGQLGYVLADGTLNHPQGRRAIFVGDLVDRGPATPAVLALVRAAVTSGAALCVAGNHDAKLARALAGRKITVSHGLERSLAQLASLDDAGRKQTIEFLEGLISHYVLDGGRLVVAHAGLPDTMHGRSSSAVRSFAMYGETTGETDEFGLPVRYNWAKDYRGKAMVVYGHTPVPQAEWLNNTICIDTGCVFGGKLTALRYPERELVSVSALAEHYPPSRPLAVAADTASAQQAADDLLDYADVSGKRYITTRLMGTLQIREENAVAALEVMSRFALDPRWLIYLPPTMSPSETSARPGLLEHPAEAFGHFRAQGVERVMCQEKHMGSRAVVVYCRDEEVAARRFGLRAGGHAVIYTRTGRRFFTDDALERGLLDALGAALAQSRMWETLASDWVCLDCELMPWSAKALELVKSQYAAVGAAGEAMLAGAVAALASAVARTRDAAPILETARARQDALAGYRDAYRRYCREVTGAADLQLAPFHILASEGAVHADKSHEWHMQRIAELAASSDGMVIATPHRVVNLADESSVQSAIDWWTTLTDAGGEGMVVKPIDFVARGPKGLVQPALKCRGPEYLRIIYGPEYRLEGNLERLRARGLGGKRALALREFALGIEALERFVRKEPLRKTHECVFGVLALESEAVDPRL